MRRRLLDAHPGDRSRDDQLLDLARALEDRVDIRDFAFVESKALQTGHFCWLYIHFV